MSSLRAAGRATAAAGMICATGMVAAAADDNPRLTEILNSQCRTCHVDGGEAGLIKRGDLAYSSDNYIIKVILNGLPDKGMEGYSATLSADDAAWIAAQLRKGALE